MSASCTLEIATHPAARELWPELRLEAAHLLFGPSPWMFEARGDPGESAQQAIAHRTGEPLLAGHVVCAADELHYAVMPACGAERGRDPYAATAVALDIVFANGMLASQLGLVDQHGVALDPVAAHAAGTHYPDQWNYRSVSLARCAGLEIAQILLRVWFGPIDTTSRMASADQQSNGEPPIVLRGLLDAISIKAPSRGGEDPLDWVRTTRGSNSTIGYSRGNTAPLVARPHGFVFGLAVTDAADSARPYSYQPVGTVGPKLEALAVSHLPSPWLGDWGVFQIMPVLDGPSSLTPDSRARGFSHDDELDRPHHHRVTLAGGISAELSATHHCLLMRFGYPGAQGTLVFDQLDHLGELTLPPAGGQELSAYVAGPRGGYPRTYLYGYLDTPIAAAEVAPAKPGGRVSGWVSAELDADRALTLRLGTSFISVAQARRNLLADGLVREAGGRLHPAASFAEVVAAGAAEWNRALGRVRVSGATADQLVTLYSGMYRIGLYPNFAHEDVAWRQPESEQPQLAHGPVFVDASVRSAEAGAPRPGRLSVNSGAWDAYRTSWPALMLLEPDTAGQLLDGLLGHYRDHGWTSRWACPGPVDCMTGTATDTVLADAMVKGIAGFDYELAYESALRNATVPSRDERFGRKGLARSIFRGYTDTDTPEGMSWTLDSALDDNSIATMAGILLDSAGEPGYPPARLRALRAERAYLLSRATRYANCFDPRVGFFQGRRPDGSWRHDPREFDPAVWGYDYTETNAWGASLAAAHDGGGLAWLYGGPAGMAVMMDQMLATPETGDVRQAGSYAFAIHEMLEARDARMGMLALSNQPAHHLPFMYMFAGQHHKTQAILRAALARLFVGSEIGQGYLGDEDNGEMSAWYLWAALGLYPLVPASGEYVITAPLWPRAEVGLPGGRRWLIEAPRSSPDDVYIQRVWVDGRRWEAVTLRHRDLVAGGRMRVELGSVPSRWGEGNTPESLTPLGNPPQVLLDLTTPGAARGGAATFNGPAGAAADMFADDSAGPVLELRSGDWVGYGLQGPAEVQLYTVTISRPGEYAWILEGLRAGHWEILDNARQEFFKWPLQTRPFLVDPGPPVAGLRFVASSAIGLSQLEFCRFTSAPAAGIVPTEVWTEGL
ncbi:MAG: GH92 family glycosyl hydrolase [Candidatus Nanopelagicales bacterium]